MSKRKSAPPKRVARQNNPLAVQHVDLPPAVAEGLKTGSLTVVRAEQSSFSGPLPHPDILKGYEECLAGAADRIIKMTESQVSHRQAMESGVIKSDIWRANWGMFLSFVVCIVSVLCGTYIASTGQHAAGATIAAGPVGLIGAAYGVGVYQRRIERAAKATMMVQADRR